MAQGVKDWVLSLQQLESLPGLQVHCLALVLPHAVGTGKKKKKKITSGAILPTPRHSPLKYVVSCRWYAKPQSNHVVPSGSANSTQIVLERLINKRIMRRYTHQNDYN